MNAGGIIIVVLGVALVIVGLRNTQSNVFPWFFKTTKPDVTPAGGGHSGAG